MTESVQSDRLAGSNLASANEAMAVMPDETGHFGPYGGRFVSETLMTALAGLDQAYKRLKNHKNVLTLLHERVQR